MKRIIALILILIAPLLFVISEESENKYTEISNNVYSVPNDITINPNWEYVKHRLFSGKGEGEYVYKLNDLQTDSPLLVSLDSATQKDSLAVNEVINKLRTIIPNRKIDYFNNFAGRSYQDVEMEIHDTNNEKLKINGIPFYNLRFSTIHLNFGEGSDATLFDDIIGTLLPDGSSIERTAPPRTERFPKLPNKVWFHLKETLSYEKREQYIQYELLRTLCYIYPNLSHSRFTHVEAGVFFTPNYIPESAEFNEKDKFLLKKLYADDFTKQFKDYLYSTYSWRYASNFLNKTYTKSVTWAIIICYGLIVFLLMFSLYHSKIIKNSYLHYFYPILFITVSYVNQLYIYKYITDLNFDITKEFYFLFIAAAFLALIESVIFWFSEKFWVDKIDVFSLKLTMKVLFTFLVLNIPGVVLLVLANGEMDGFLEFYLSTLIFTIVLALGRGLLIYLNYFSENLIKQKDLELSKLKEVNSQAEVKLLQSQINPHFLYNALNSIASLTHKNADKTEKMALSLSDLFKYTINRKGRKDSTIGDEVEMVNNYLEVEQIRFDDRLNFTINVDKSLQNTKVPMFLIQPLIENAVKHGISKVENNGQISLIIQKEDVGFSITVEDNGPDFPEGLVSGHGLQTVFDLLRLTYGDKASISWKNTPTKNIKITIEN